MKARGFGAWLRRRRRETDAIGDLARDVCDDEALRGRPLTPKALREHMEALGACDAAQETLRAAVEKWRDSLSVAARLAPPVPS